MDWEVGWRFKREWTYLYLWLLHIVIWQKPTHYCKAIILQLKVDKLKKKVCLVSQAVERHGWSCLDHREAWGSGRRRAKDQHGLQSSPASTTLHFRHPLLTQEASASGWWQASRYWRMKQLNRGKATPYKDKSEICPVGATVRWQLLLLREEACFPRSSCLKGFLQFSLCVSSPKLEESGTLRYLPFPSIVA